MPGARLWTYIAVSSLPFLIGAIGLIMMFLVDPYGVRGSALIPAQLASHRYPDREWPRLLNVTSRQPHDMVLLGSSTMMRVDSDMLREAFSGTRAPVNLSYIAPRPADLSIALGKLVANPSIARVVLMMDFSLMERRGWKSTAGEHLDHLARTSWRNAADFSFSTAAASFHRVAFGTYSLPWWRSDIPNFMEGARKITDDPARIGRIKAAVVAHTDLVFARSPLTCNDIPFIAESLVPFLKTSDARHLELDIAFPPLPYLLHYDWIENRPRFGILLPGPVFDQFITFKRCVVDAVERHGSQKVRVLALDSDDVVSGNLANYMDSAHLIDADAYRRVLRMIAEGKERLSSATLDAHDASLRAKVLVAGQRLIEVQSSTGRDEKRP